jgi:anti-sigma-K factor RskA
MGGFGLAAAGIAAALIVMAQPAQVITKIQPAPAPSGELLNASLVSTEGHKTQPLFIAAYDPDRKAIIITSLLPAGANPEKVQELWLIKGKANPKPLGFLEPGKSKVIPLKTDLAGEVAEGATLAVSIEKPGGSTDPNGPQGPVVGAGALSKL